MSKADGGGFLLKILYYTNTYVKRNGRCFEDETRSWQFGGGVTRRLVTCTLGDERVSCFQLLFCPTLSTRETVCLTKHRITSIYWINRPTIPTKMARSFRPAVTLLATGLFLCWFYEIAKELRIKSIGYRSSYLHRVALPYTEMANSFTQRCKTQRMTVILLTREIGAK